MVLDKIIMLIIIFEILRFKIALKTIYIWTHIVKNPILMLIQHISLLFFYQIYAKELIILYSIVEIKLFLSQKQADLGCFSSGFWVVINRVFTDYPSE